MTDIRESNGGMILNRLIPETIVASSQLSGYEVAKTMTDFPMEKFLSASNTVTIDMVFQNPVTFTGVAITNHNLTVNESISLRLYSDSNFSTLIVENVIPVHLINTFLIIENPSPIQYVQLFIDGSGPIEIGSIFLGEAFQFPVNFKEFYKQELVVMKDIYTMDEGYHFESSGDTTTPEYWKFEFSFDNVPHDQTYGYSKCIREGSKVLIPSFTGGESFFGVVPNKTLSLKRGQTHDAFQLSFLEHALGVKYAGNY